MHPGTYTVCEVPVAHKNSAVVRLRAVSQPEEATGRQQRRFNTTCVTVVLKSPENTEVKFVDEQV